MIVAIIPVRLESSRLPQKALKEIEGLPMIIHTMKRTQLASSLDEVYIATDSAIICDLVKKHSGKVIMTSKNHKIGSDRIAEAADVDTTDDLKYVKKLMLKDTLKHKYL